MKSIYDGLILRAKICEQCSEQFIVAVDDEDICAQLRVIHGQYDGLTGSTSHTIIDPRTNNELTQWWADPITGQVKFPLIKDQVIRIGKINAKE